MEERLRSDLAESPLYGFIQAGWLEWGQEIVSVQVREDDFLLYVLWGLDMIKQEGTDVCKNFRSRVYMGLRTHFLDCGYTPQQNDLEYVANLACACCLYCYGLVLTDVHDASDLYSGLVSGFGKHWDSVKEKWNEIRKDVDASELKKWIVEYMKSEEYYTSGERIEWLENEPENLPDVVRLTRGPVQITQVNIGQFNNAPGATFTDKSLNVKIEGNNGEYKPIQ